MTAAALERKYTADLASYKKTTTAIDKQVAYYEKIAESPGTEHPSYAKFKRSVEQQAKGTRETLAGTLRRRGITGGKQVKLLKDVQTETERTLATTLADISAQATAKGLEIETLRPAKPYLGGIYTPTTLPAQTTPAIPAADFSGYGALAAYYGGKPSTQARGDEWVGSMQQPGSMDYSYWSNPDYGADPSYWRPY